jgi:hypothetical protein
LDYCKIINYINISCMIIVNICDFNKFCNHLSQYFMWSDKFEWIITKSHYINYWDNFLFIYSNSYCSKHYRNKWRFICHKCRPYITRTRRFLFSSFTILKYLDETDNFATANSYFSEHRFFDCISRVLDFLIDRWMVNYCLIISAISRTRAMLNAVWYTKVLY